MGNLFCGKCRKTMSDTNFYQYKDGTKCELCKACLTMHVNNFEPESYLWILEKFDVPYIPSEWNVLRDRAYQKDPYKMNGMSVIGKYFSKMKLKQWKEFGWADSARLQAEAEAKAAQNPNPNKVTEEKLQEMEEMYKNGEITEQQWMTYKEINAPEPEFVAADGAITTAGPRSSNNPYPENSNPFEQVDLPDMGSELSTEEKIYLATKWGQFYSASDWIYLETKYEDFMNSFDIQGAARKDTLIQICKLSLKLNQALDAGDMDSYSKLVRAYDILMKSAKFTQAQNDEEIAGNFDSVGLIVSFCEKNGGKIPEYQIDAPQDVIDTIIEDNHRYLETLVYNETSLAQRIEQFLKKKEIMSEEKADKVKAKEMGVSELAYTDEDYQEYFEETEKQRQHDQKILSEEAEEE